MALPAERYIAIGILLALAVYNIYVHIFNRFSYSSPAKRPLDSPLTGTSAYQACVILQTKYNLKPETDLTQISPSVVHHWRAMRCPTVLLTPPHGMHGHGDPTKDDPARSSIEDRTDTASMGNAALPDHATKKTDHPSLRQAAMETIVKIEDKAASFISKISHLGSHSEVADGGETHGTSGGEASESLCLDMKEQYHVVPGSSWGDLPIDKQKLWTRLHCDKIKGIERSRQEGEDGVQEKPEEAAEPAPEPETEEDSKKPAGGALPNIDKSNKDWCLDMKERYHVIPMKSWGTLPMNLMEVWRDRHCDVVFTAQRMAKRAVSQCLAEGESTPANLDSKLPLIAVMAATTTRKVTKPSTSKLALFTHLLPSLVRSLDCGFRYEYVLGFDKGDPFYDSKEGMKSVKKWFSENIEKPMAKNGIRITLRPVKVNNTLKKPGPVFIEMARAAYEAGAEYFFRINDDTELTENWPKKFVAALKSLPQPFGVVGPRCDQGNQQILTHDFVHRTHMEVFEMNYYPPQLVDWWMDDWISLVYGKTRTFKAKSVAVVHHTGAHGRRYEVDRSNEKLLGSLVREGRAKIRRWMLNHNVPESDMKVFDNDVYEKFTHLDIPKTTK